jgi:hypothetical protein
MERRMRRINEPQTLALRAPQGLHVLRYASAGRSMTPPRVMLAPPNRASGDLLLPPGMAEPVLEAPGDGVVVRALGDIEIAYVVEAGGEAVLAIEPVSSLVRPQVALSIERPRLAEAPYLPLAGGRRRSLASTTAPEEGLLLLGHVARRGDLSAKAGEWLGAADSADAIEGIELRWPGAPQGMDVAVRLTVNDYGRRTLPEASLGMFCGTRRRAAPVVGLDIGVEGRRPEGWVVDCQAAFQGLNVISARGARVALRGKTGREPLVGLRIRIGDEEAFDDEKGIQPAFAAPTGATAGRVRIFRPPA